MRLYNRLFAWGSLTQALALLALAIVAALSVSCGRTHGQSGVRSPGSGVQAGVGAPLAAPRQGRASTAPTIPLADLLKQIDAYQPPKGVDAARFAALKSELKRLLTARAAGSKIISIAPTGPGNSVTDLAATVNPAGTQATLTWTEVLPGDYDNNGVVDIGDLAPLALYYGQRTDSGPDDGHKLVVGDSDPEIGLGDIGAIANNYAARIQGYCVYRGADDGSGSVTWEATHRPNLDPVNPQWSVNRPGVPPVSTRPAYTYTDDITALADKANVRYMVVAFGDGGEGAEGNVASMLPPPAFNVSGVVYWMATRLEGATMTLTPGGLTATTAADGTFTIPNVQNGAYTVTPSKAGFVFSPTDAAVTVAGSDATGLGFRATSGLADSAWPKFHASANNASSSAYIGAQTDALKWSYATGGEVNSSPAVGADGTIYVGSYDGSVHAVNRNGSLKWKYTPGMAVESSPAISADSAVYVGSDDGNVYALNPDGTLRWKHTTGGPVKSSPTVGLDGTIYVGSGDHNVYAMSPDGSVRWQFATAGIVDSSPALSGDRVCVGSNDGYAYSLDAATGSVVWQTLTLGVNSSPAIGPDGTVFIGGSQGLYALNSADGSVRWMHNTGGQVRSSPAIGPDGTVYVASGVSVYALNYADGSLWWQRWLGFTATVESSPAIGADHTVYVGADDDNLYALNPSDGSIKWSHFLSATVKSSPAIGADGTVYVGCESHNILAFGTTGPSVRGTVTCDGAPLQGVRVTLMPIAQSAVTGSDGTYAVTDVPSGTYTLTPSMWGYAFSPPNMLVQVSTDDVIDRNFAASPAPTHVVSGTVTFGSDPLPDVSMTFSPGGLQVSTLPDGTYSANVQGGTYTLTPSKPGYAFTPTQQTVIVSGQDVPGKDFSSTATVTYSVSGTVTLSGNPLEGILVRITPGGYSSTTGADGTYTITGVSDGRDYVIAPASDIYSFTPSTRPFYLNSADVTGMDFSAIPGGLADSPWPKFHGDARNDGQSPYVGAQTGTIKWSFATGAAVNSSPVLGEDGTIYVGASNGLYALNPDGSQKWKVAATTQCSPAIAADGTIYAYASSGFSALSPSNGAVIWSRSIGGSAFPTTSVAVGSGTIYVAASLSGEYYVFALLPADGSTKWQFTCGSQITSCPAIGADGTVYVAGVNDYIYALNPLDGSVKWSYLANAAIYSSPTVAADGTVYVGSDDYWLYALNPGDGSLKWRGAGVGVIRSSPAIGPDGTIYTTTWHFAGTICAMNPADGSVKWEYNTLSLPDSSPAVDAAGSSYFGASDKYVYSMNSDGTLKWSYKTGSVVNSSPAIGADGTVYIGSSDGKVYAFGP